MTPSPFRILGMAVEGTHLLAFGMQHYGQIVIPEPWGYWVTQLAIIPMITFGGGVVLPVTCLVLGHSCLLTGRLLLWIARLPELVSAIATKARLGFSHALEWTTEKVGTAVRKLIEYLRRTDLH